MINKDQFGFFQVGDLKTYSKLEALEYAAVVKQPVIWNFNADKFSKYPWHIEPPLSLEHYYAERARQLREKYNYLVLWYSGGADSHNVLMSFVKNNIFVNEIAQYHSMKGSKDDRTTNMNQEVFETSIPTTQKLLETNPLYKNTKHTVIDLTDLMTTLYSDVNNKWDNYYHANTYVAPGALARTYMREKIPHFKNLIDQGFDVCFVWALEKPQITLEDKKFYLNFKDGFDGSVSARTQRLGREWEHDEFFYWSPDCPDLIAKQAHVVKNYLEKLTPADVDNFYVVDKPYLFDINGVNVNLLELSSTVHVNGKLYSLTNQGLHRLIYPDWDPTTIVASKPASLIFNIRDQWWFNSANGNIGQRHFGQSVVWWRNHVCKLDPSMWWEFKFDRKKTPYSGGIKSIKNSYFLGNINDQS